MQARLGKTSTSVLPLAALVPKFSEFVLIVAVSALTKVLSMPRPSGFLLILRTFSLVLTTLVLLLSALWLIDAGLLRRLSALWLIEAVFKPIVLMLTRLLLMLTCYLLIPAEFTAIVLLLTPMSRRELRLRTQRRVNHIERNRRTC